MKRHLNVFTAAAVVLILAGCANHLEDVVREIPENTRTPLENQYILNMDREIPDSSTFKITLEQVEKVKVTVHQVRKQSSFYTPYSGWRESYEFFAGLGLFPVAIVANVFSVFTFGMFPFEWSREVTKYSIDGMNPCMNFESRSRMEEIPTKVERILVDSYTETKRKPLSEEWLIVKIGSDSYQRVRTNRVGQAEIELLSINLEKTKPVTARHLDIFLEKGNVKIKSIPMSRKLITRIANARRAMMKYYSVPNGAELAACIKRLEDLSFEGLALELEESELRKHPDFRAAFEAAVK